MLFIEADTNLISSELLVLDGPGQAVMEANVQLCAGETQTVSDNIIIVIVTIIFIFEPAGQVPAVVREVGVA